ncbi:MAG TPA: hypothetical protein VK589_30055 [Chryseolinea sp.]|nr:hypothetical protein [Chryseolinea sp.]
MNDNNTSAKVTGIVFLAIAAAAVWAVFHFQDKPTKKLKAKKA